MRQAHLAISAVSLAAGVAIGVGFVNLSPQSASAHDPEHGASNVSELKYAEPVKDMHLYLCAFHIAKNNPDFEVEAHHYCNMRDLTVTGGELHQCVVYDSKEAPAKLLGTEYIISEQTYQQLPEEEKKYWHPHAYEVLSGQLWVPDLPDLGDEALGGFITSWGKTFHTWPDPSTEIPMGEPLLMWSAGADGQISEEAMKKRDQAFPDIDATTDDVRQRRLEIYGMKIPNVDLPESEDEIGRQWTSDGEDRPTPRE